MLYCVALGSDHENKKNWISETVSGEIAQIKTTTAGATLTLINNQLKNENAPWYAVCSTGTGFPWNCILYTLIESHTHAASQSDPDLDQIIAMMAAFYKDPSNNKEIIGPMLKAITAWINQHNTDERDLALCKTFLIFSKTCAIKTGLLSSVFMNASDKAKLIAQFNQIAEAATVAITTISPLEAVKTLEQYLDENLPENPVVEKNTIKRDEYYARINQQLTKQESDFDVLYALKSMQKLFLNNQEESIGQEYFSALMGVKADVPSMAEKMSVRRAWFDLIVATSDKDDQDYWTQRAEAIKNPSPEEITERQTAFVASTVTSIPTAAARVLWNMAIIQSALQTEWVQNMMKMPVVQQAVQVVADYTTTNDFRDKTRFMKLLETRIKAVCEKIANNNPEMTQQLQEASAEKIEEIKTKTACIRTLYEADKKLADFLEKNNTIVMRVMNFFLYHIPIKGPIGSLVHQALGYRTALNELRQEVHKSQSQDLKSRLDNLLIQINQLDEKSNKIKQRESFVTRLVTLKRTQNASEDKGDDSSLNIK